MASGRSFGPLVLAAFAALAVAAAPAATADPQPQVPCGVLDQLRDNLDNSVSVGIAGVRIVITSPYLSGGQQNRDAESNLVLASHGVHAMQDINQNNIVPGLAPLLDNLSRATDDMSQAVEALFQPTWGGFEYGSGMSLAWPQPATWTVIDYADQKKNDVYALVNALQPTCTP
ncbi:MAG: hypothetical protein U0R81_13490 [Mycobacterium sp.]